MMFGSLLDLVWQVVINKNIYKGQFYYLATLNEEQIQTWLSKNGYAMEIKDKETVRRCVIRLWDLAPEDVVEESKRGHGAGITI